jgi:tetratricopeptide (TPR) repeat protein
MESRSVWPLLRAGKAEQEQGLELCRQAYARDPSASYIMQLGVAYLWLKQYAQAWEHFSSTIARKAPRGISNKSDSFYGMAGVAKWCLGKRREAIAEWALGLKAERVRTSGAHIPLLLYFASIISPELYDISAAKKSMLEKTRDVRIQAWPGPIVQWILGQIKAGELIKHCQGRDMRDNLWQVKFYRSLMQFERSRISDFRETMHKLTDIKQPEWQDEGFFLSRMWDEEYFLARYEATAVDNQISGAVGPEAVKV